MIPSPEKRNGKIQYVWMVDYRSVLRTVRAALIQVGTDRQSGGGAGVERVAPVEAAKSLPPVTIEKVEKVGKVDKPGNKVAKVYFKNCTAARAAGYSDMLRGEPGYASKLDRDHDGIACETSGWN
jgi:hypothetical protein